MEAPTGRFAAKHAAGVPGLLVKAVLVLLLLVAAAVPLVNYIDDPDFFWHLQTGNWIREHGSLPQEYLFSLTAPTMTDNQRFIMTSYWAVQVVYSLLHAVGGLTAIALLRCALMALLIGTLILRRAGKDSVVFLGCVLMGVSTLRFYPFERPQVFAFLYFSLLLLLLERLRNARPEAPTRFAPAALPLLMVVWANSHGSYIVGQGVILLYLAAEGVKFTHRALAPLPKSRYRLLLAAGTAGILAALLNPNTYRALYVANPPAWLTAGNTEYVSTVTIFRMTGSPDILVYWYLLVLALLSFALPRRMPDITRLALVAGTGIISFTQNRYLPFFILSAVPVIEEALSRESLAKAGRFLVAVPALATSLYLLPSDLETLQRFEDARVVSPLYYPVDAADFIASRDIQGDMYNFWPWGGYLLWRLHPAKVFCDGRNIQHSVFQLNASIEAGQNQLVAGQPLWKSIFKSYGIRYAVLPMFDPRHGAVMNLLFSLAASPDWAPVFVGVNSVVFVENTPENRRIGLPRIPSGAQLINLLIRRCAELGGNPPSYPFAHIARGDLLAGLQRYDEARAAYLSALRLVPLNPYANGRLSALGTATRNGRDALH